jgi:hypothetical protein
MHLRTVGILALLPLLAASPATIPSADKSAAAGELAREFADALARSHYMESKQSRDVQVPGWEGFPTRRYTYAVADMDGTSKTADVILLDPTAEQIARWIVQAVSEVKGTYDAQDGRKLFRHILGQSGGQFPVAGVVYEDILPPDGKNENYCFRDGVTVEIETVPHRGTEPMTPQQVAASIDGRIKRVFTYARIASTSPRMWIDAGGSPNVLRDGKPTDRWPSAIRAAYQAAWTSDRNALIVAWAKANLK